MHELESAAFAAWPALQQDSCQGWLLRYGQGYTQRANSANALPGARPLDKELLRQIEARFEAHGLPTIFRLASGAAPDGADQALAQAGYRQVDPSWVMTLDLPSSSPVDVGSAAAGWASHAADWLGLFQAVAGKLGADQAIHLQLLQAIDTPCAFAVTHDGAVPVCCGLAVLGQGQQQGHLGLFDIATAPAQRGRGLATALCQQLLDWGQRQGAHTAYLQVAAANTVARRLYGRLGFHEAYPYHYRVAP